MVPEFVTVPPFKTLAAVRVKLFRVPFACTVRLWKTSRIPLYFDDRATGAVYGSDGNAADLSGHRFLVKFGVALPVVIRLARLVPGGMVGEGVG